MMLKSEAETLKCNRLLSLLIPTAVILSACQQVLAVDHSFEENLSVSRDVKSYRQVVAVETETGGSSRYTITEAVLFPEETAAYGSRIAKSAGAKAEKTEIRSTKEGASRKTNSGNWEQSATPEPLFSALEVVPYEHFAVLAELFAQKGAVAEIDGQYLINYSGSDAAVNREVCALLEQFAVPDTVYEVQIAVNKEDHRLASFSLVAEAKGEDGKTKKLQEINSTFSLYNTGKSKPILENISNR